MFFSRATEKVPKFICWGNFRRTLASCVVCIERIRWQIICILASRRIALSPVYKDLNNHNVISYFSGRKTRWFLPFVFHTKEDLELDSMPVVSGWKCERPWTRCQLIEGSDELTNWWRKKLGQSNQIKLVFSTSHLNGRPLLMQPLWVGTMSFSSLVT